MNLNAEGLRFNRDMRKESLALSSLEGRNVHGANSTAKKRKKARKYRPVQNTRIFCLINKENLGFVHLVHLF